MKVLIIHHLEPIWNNGYKKFGTNFDKLLERFSEYLENNIFNKIILTRFEEWKIDFEEYSLIAEKIDIVHSYGYGWNLECFYDSSPDDISLDDAQTSLDCGGSYINSYGQEVCKGGQHSEVVFIPDWIRDLKCNEVFISGAFDGECLEDLEIALNFCQIDYNRIEELIL